MRCQPLEGFLPSPVNHAQKNRLCGIEPSLLPSSHVMVNHVFLQHVAPRAPFFFQPGRNMKKVQATAHTRFMPVQGFTYARFFVFCDIYSGVMFIFFQKAPPTPLMMPSSLKKVCYTWEGRKSNTPGITVRLVLFVDGWCCCPREMKVSQVQKKSWSCECSQILSDKTPPSQLREL